MFQVKLGSTFYKTHDMLVGVLMNIHIILVFKDLSARLHDGQCLRPGN